MYKIIFALLFSSITLIHMETASASTNTQTDPCAELTGHWKGEWTVPTYGCKYDIELDVSNYKNNVQFAVNYKRTKGMCTSEELAIITGMCTDGKLDLVMHQFKKADYTLTGRVFGGLLTMENDRVTAYARKLQ